MHCCGDEELEGQGLLRFFLLCLAIHVQQQEGEGALYGSSEQQQGARTAKEVLLLVDGFQSLHQTSANIKEDILPIIFLLLVPPPSLHPSSSCIITFWPAHLLYCLSSCHHHVAHRARRYPCAILLILVLISIYYHKPVVDAAS